MCDVGFTFVDEKYVSAEEKSATARRGSIPNVVPLPRERGAAGPVDSRDVESEAEIVRTCFRLLPIMD